jgi:hypothetical protein
MTDRKKPGVAFWTTVVLVVVSLLYVLSFGPACWITSRCSLRGAWISTAYRPLIWSMETGPDAVSTALVWYSLAGVSQGWGWDINPDGHYGNLSLPTW